MGTQTEGLQCLGCSERREGREQQAETDLGFVTGNIHFGYHASQI